MASRDLHRILQESAARSHLSFPEELPAWFWLGFSAYWHNRFTCCTASWKPVEINKFIIQKGLDKQLVLYWYQDRGRIITSEYWAKVYMVWDAIRRNRTDGAFVRITVPFTGEDEERAVVQGRAFAETIFPLLSEYLPS